MSNFRGLSSFFFLADALLLLCPVLIIHEADAFYVVPVLNMVFLLPTQDAGPSRCLHHESCAGRAGYPFDVGASAGGPGGGCHH